MPYEGPGVELAFPPLDQSDPLFLLQLQHRLTAVCLALRHTLRWSLIVAFITKQTSARFSLSNHNHYIDWHVATGWTQRWQSEYLFDQYSTLCAEPSPLAAKALWANTHSKTQHRFGTRCSPFSTLFCPEPNRRRKPEIADFTHCSSSHIGGLISSHNSVSTTRMICRKPWNDPAVSVRMLYVLCQCAEQHGSVRHRAPEAVCSNTVCMDACSWSQSGTAESLQVHLSY